MILVGMVRWRSSSAVVLLALAGAACAGGDGEGKTAEAEQRVSERLITADLLGAGWAAIDTPQPLATKASLDPPCPVELGAVDFVVDAIAAVEIGNVAERIGLNHTVAELSGDPSAPMIVRDAWAAMDCHGADFDVADFDVADVDGVADGVVGVQFTARSGPLVQVALVRATGDQVAYLVVSGEGGAPLDVARELAADF